MSSATSVPVTPPALSSHSATGSTRAPPSRSPSSTPSLPFSALRRGDARPALTPETVHHPHRHAPSRHARPSQPAISHVCLAATRDCAPRPPPDVCIPLSLHTHTHTHTHTLLLLCPPPLPPSPRTNILPRGVHLLLPASWARSRDLVTRPFAPFASEPHQNFSSGSAKAPRPPQPRRGPAAVIEPLQGLHVFLCLSGPRSPAPGPFPASCTAC